LEIPVVSARTLIPFVVPRLRRGAEFFPGGNMRFDPLSRHLIVAVLGAMVFTPGAFAQTPRRSAHREEKQARAPEDRTESQLRDLLAAVGRLEQLILQQNRELEAQRALIREQQEKLERLEQRVTQNGPVTPPVVAMREPAEPPRDDDVKLLEAQVEAMADSQKELGERVNKLQTDTTAAGRSTESKLRQIGNFRLSGDLRFRYEPFFQDGQTTRQRQRIRARINLQGNLTDTLYGGVTFATGSLDDPISTNQTITGFFNRKQVGFDRAWIQWTPKEGLRGHAVFGIGKFAYPWIRTPLTFDNDLNPEGIYSRLNWDFKDSVFRGISVVGFHLPFFERGGSTNPTTGVRADGSDAFIAGAQLQTRWKFGDRVTLGSHIATLNFRNPDFIAQAHSANAATAGLANSATGNQSTSNCVRTNASNQVVGYCSRFLYLNWITTLAVNTGYARWPVNITFDFNNNMRATRIIQTGTAAPTGQMDNPERSAYWAEIQFGRLSERKDIRFGYTFARVERDAVITAFNESDFRAGSNLRQHRLNFNYRWFNNVTLNYALWLGTVANAADPFTGTGGAIAFVPGGKRAVSGSSCNVSPFTGCKDNTLKRMQFDFIYTF
jgi:uncharacterized protein YlxW (UPF0749 family)